MKLFRGKSLSGGTASRAEVYGLFIASIVLVGGGVGGAYAISNGALSPTTSQTEQSASPEESAAPVTDGDQPQVSATPSDQPQVSATPKIDCLSLPQLPHSGTPIYGGTAQVLQGEVYVPPAGYGAMKSGTMSGSNIPTYDNYTWGLELTKGLSGTGLQLHELGCKIAEAHGYWGGQYSIGLSLSGDTILHIYNSEVDLGILDRVLRSVGAR
jgi:hypothetical protein